ncbi:DNA-binding transcriptional regulator, HxlR family [Marinilactibacillus piezotolerans]|uniref:DNA-binding transcriptional regulator, HxlR family n=1 Tax=Marinilactibacillus piezotolerans TaxID=258723 RepID=A0A1I3Y1L4_9LACT|nr:DNA-binding transcriptional regulator, HxlR family [Marinilactibacillus piezotolerans]
MIEITQDKIICPKFEQTFSILGKKWTGLIIDVLLEGPHRFKDLSQSIPEVSDRVLVERLKELEQTGIVTKELDENCELRSGYCLTTKGLALESVMKEVQSWADEWISEEECHQA